MSAVIEIGSAVFGAAQRSEGLSAMSKDSKPNSSSSRFNLERDQHFVFDDQGVTAPGDPPSVDDSLPLVRNLARRTEIIRTGKSRGGSIDRN